MDTTDFVLSPEKTTIKSFASDARTLTGLNPYTGTWGENEIIHFSSNLQSRV